MSETINSLFGGDWQASLQATRAITLILWGGLALLTITLFILMRTKWGEAKPLSKCVALSVLAHVLFGAYAYGTRLFMDAPPGPNKDVVHLTVLDPSQMELQEGSPQDTAPWDELADTSTPAGVELPAADRMASTVGELDEATEEIVSQAPETPDFAFGAQDTGVVRQLPVDGIDDSPREPLPAPPESVVRDSVVEAAPIDAPAPQAKTTAIAASPAPLPEADRASVDTAPLAEPAAVAAAPAPPELDMAIQQLAEAAMETRRPEARPADLDQLTGAGADIQPAPPAAADGAMVARAAPAWAPAISQGGDGLPAPRRLGDGRVVPPVYRARVPDLRLTIAQRHGGSEQTEAAVDAALHWLVGQQREDGRWSAAQHGGGREDKVLGHDRRGAGANADNAMTGLAVLAMLAAGHTHYEGQYREHVQRGLEYLVGSQRTDGRMAGDAKLFARMYCHGMASLAVSEAYAMTGDQRLQQYVSRAVQYSLSAQDGYSGGWRYQVGDRGGDMSQFGWQVMALKSAELADVNVPLRAQAGMKRFLSRCGKGAHGGLAAYRPQERESPTMTAEALACRYFLGIKPTAAQRREATAYLTSHLPGTDRMANYYYWYYGTLAMFQCQGDAWQTWNAALTRELLQRQVPVGSDHAGSFPPDSRWGGYGGRVYTTAMAALTLEVYYRYLPVLDEPAVAGRPQVGPGRVYR